MPVREKQTTLETILHVGYWRFFGRCTHLYLPRRARTISLKKQKKTMCGQFNLHVLVSKNFLTFIDESSYSGAFSSLNWTYIISGKYLHSLPRNWSCNVFVENAILFSNQYQKIVLVKARQTQNRGNFCNMIF